ncbi:hypothetical protein J3R82DRAFT_10739 [Butyriboletus roseoflavus]|nr:hypothetical protein J3R82DRAFT_10739 [Butyriboletus roseoflavus]
MPSLIRTLSRRDAVFLLVGAFSMHLFTAMASLASHSIIITAAFPEKAKDELAVHEYPPQNDHQISELLYPIPSSASGEQSTTFRNMDLSSLSLLPETTIVEHVPGWTLFRDIYMANGTLLILTSSPSVFPDTRLMISTGLPSENNLENIALREPTSRDMDIVTPDEALQRWGNHSSTRRVWSVEGNTLLVNEPSQCTFPLVLKHYYHFCAELLLGTWSLWAGSVNPGPPPPIHRAIFPHSSGPGWRDKPGFNGYFLRAAFPSLTVEVDVDWNDRVVATSASIDSGVHRAWHFPYLLLADRSAAFRGKLCGLKNHRIASESVDALVSRSKLDNYGLWWRSIKYAVWRFAGVTIGGEVGFFGHHALDDKSQASLPPDFEETEKVVITYISRQSSRRHLIPEDHKALVESLEALVQRKNAEITSMMNTTGIAGKEWELNVVRAEEMTKDDQVRLVARTTILLGVHGNGLSHLILMPRTNVSAVIEIFYPEGFAHDYEWTTRALGMKYFGVWNDTYFTETTTAVHYPDGFQGDSIPVYGPNIASIIERRVAGEV